MGEETFKVDKLRTRLEGNLASPNRWKIELPTLQGKQKMNGEAVGRYRTEDLETLCTNARIPGKQITTIDRAIGLVKQSPAVGFESGQAAFTWYLDQQYSLRQWAQDWLDCVVSPEPPYEVGFLEKYQADITVIQCDRMGNPIYKTKLINCFPLNVAEIELNNAAQTTAMEMTMTVAYKIYESESLRV